LGGALRVDGAIGAAPRAVLRHVAHTGRRAAPLARRRERVGRTIVADAVAALGDVAHAGARPTRRRALRVRWTRGARAGAALGHVAHPRRRTADGRGRLERV